jgi:hypothetical protein
MASFGPSGHRHHAAANLLEIPFTLRFAFVSNRPGDEGMKKIKTWTGDLRIYVNRLQQVSLGPPEVENTACQEDWLSRRFRLPPLNIFP